MSVWHTQARLLAERFDGLLHCDLAEVTDDDVARLVCAAYVLGTQHRVDKRGRCPHCYSRLRWWSVKRRRTCTVHSAFLVAMNQPLNMVGRWVQDWGTLTGFRRR
ncbi:MAG: hypothetical protein ACRDRM_12465 [Pseudonocardiaceae bacterium]